jgi:hypothetical protein
LKYISLFVDIIYYIEYSIYYINKLLQQVTNHGYF